MTTTSVTTSTTSAYSITSGNALVVASGGNVSSASILSGGQLVVSGGTESAATVAFGATEIVSKGTASGDVIYGVLSNVSGAATTLSNEIIASGGIFYEVNSATVSGTQVLKGGTMIINGNTSGVSTNTTLISGGLLELTSPKATIGGALVFSGGGNILETSATISAGFGDFAVISGFTSTDKIDVALIGSAGASLSFASSGGNEVVTLSGTSGGVAVSESFIFAGTATYTSSTLSLVADGAGVDIIYTSGSTPVGSTTSVTTSTGSGAYTETSGNTLLVANGGSVSAAVISSGGALVVSGGADVAAIVVAGGSETVSAGSASGDRIYGSATIAGGSVSGEQVQSGGKLTIAAGAAETSATVSGGGSETVLGTATGDAVYGVVSTISGTAAAVNGATVFSGGQVTILNASAASGTLVMSGGSLNVNGAATATDTVLSAGGTAQLQSPKATLAGGLTFAGGGSKLVVGAVVTTSAGSFGEQAVISGFSTTDVIDVTAIAPTGAALAFTSSGGNEVVTLTGTSAGTAVAESFIFAGTSGYNTYTLGLQADGAGGVDLVYNPNATALTISNGTTSGLNVGSGQTVTVLAGATVSSTTVTSGGSLVISGTDHAANIAAGGAETVYGSASGDQVAGTVTVTGAGASASGETLLSGGALAVAGGSNLSASIAAGASVTLTNSGHTSGDQIRGSVTAIGTSATVSGETVFSGGSLTVNGGADSAALISAGGSESITNSGSASGDQIYGAVTASGTGVTVSGATLHSGATMLINTGAVDAGSVILAGGNETVLGSASGDQIYGTQLVSAGTALVTSETVYGGGAIDVFLKGGVASATTVLSGGALNISGAAFASNTVLSGGGIIALQSPKADITGSLVFAGGNNVVEITGTTSAGFGDLAINSGFTATDRIDLAATAFVGSALSLSQTISGGNTVAQVLSAGAVVETFIFAGTNLSGQLGLVSDGNGGVNLEMPPISVTTSVTTPTVSGAYSETATNTLLVLGGGSVTAATIESGAFLTVAGGTDSGSTILAGGVETILSGAAGGDQIYGTTTVSGGSVSGDIVLGGGTLAVAAGATVSNVTLGGHGTLDLAAATASVAGALVFTGGNNTLETTAVPGAGFGDQAVISGFTTADQIDVTGIAPAGATLAFTTNAAGNAVATVSGGGLSESFIFADPAVANAGTMSLMADGSGGVALVLDTTPVVAITSLGGAVNTATRIVNGTVDVSADPEAIGTTVSVYEGSTVVGTGTVGSDGHWNANVGFLNTHGANILTASDTDRAGNTGTTGQAVTYNVDTTAAAFTAGNLVVSISGNGDGSGAYGDNQASPITLEQLTTNGTIVSQMVLPQTTTTVNGVTEYVISGEYGSSSEGTLELSADGHSLVIAGYGVNALTFNGGGAAVYGTLALAQTTSVPGGTSTPVARVVADINANGTVDTSTALYNIYNLNNPRSVATIDGSAFYLGGQGVKGDSTQGLWYAVDGSSAGTRINGASDVRTAEIYNGQLYVSSDSSQGVTNISNYGPLPTTATAPVVLTAISGSVVLTAATANTVNTGSIGTSVNLSPESFFFANANTLYVADGGAPKAGGVGDGGLQKWVYSGGQWSLEYTLSAGLNLVNNSTGSGTSGLIGLTGKVVGNSVQLYTTNESLTDLGQTAVYGITDQLNATSGAGESFTTLLTASAGENIRGIAFAPTAYAPVITGTVAGQTTQGEAAVTPFAGVTISDPNGNAVETLTITLGGNGGTLAGSGLGGGTGGVYTLSGTAAAVTTALDALVFTPAAGAAEAVTTTSFSLSDLSSANATPVVDTVTTVLDRNGPAAPAISAVVGQPVTGSTIEVTGSGLAGATITLYADGGTTAVGTGTVAANGSFDITTTASFADGNHSLTATQTDAAALTSTASAGFAVAVDPTAPVIASAIGQAAFGGTIEVKGTGIAGDTVRLYVDGSSTLAGSGTVAGDGSFDITTLASYAAGSHGVTATQSDAAGLTSATAASTASVFRLATASVGSLLSNLVVHVGDVVSRALNIGNGAAGDGYSEKLQVTVTGTTGAVTATAPGAEIAGGTSGNALIGISTASSGHVSGTATLGFASDGSGIDGTGTTTIGSTTVSLAATVDNYAQAAVEKVSGTGTLTGDAAHGYTLDLGTLAQGTAAVAAGLGVLNSASGLADLLSGNFTIASGSSAFGNFNFGNFAGLAAGQADAAPFITLSTRNTGTFSETITLHATGSNAGGYSGALANETITVTGTVAASDILTTHADSIIGGPANATIVAATKTLSTGDVINPTAGNDTLDLVGGGSFDLTKPATLANITTLNVQEGASTAEQTIKLRAGLDLTVNVASSAMSGAGIKIVGALNNDTIHLGSGADSVKLAGGNNLVTVGGTGQNVTTGNGNVTVQASAADAGVLVKGGTGHDVLEITTGGTAILNAKTSHVTVELDHATTLVMNNAKTVSVIGSTGADTITAGGSGQTITGNGGGDTLIGAAAGHDTFKDSLANFAGATIGGFTSKTDKIDVTDFASSAIGFSFAENAAGTVGTLTMTAGGHTASVQLLGQYMASGFVVASDGGAGTAITYNPAAHSTIIAAAH